MSTLTSIVALTVLASLPSTGSAEERAVVPGEEKANYSFVYRSDSGEVYTEGELSWETRELKEGSFQLTRRLETGKYQSTVHISTLPASLVPARLTAKLVFRGGSAEYRIGYSKRPLPVYSTSPHGVIDTTVDAPEGLYDYSQLEFLPRTFGLKPGTSADFLVFQLDIPNGTTRTYEVHSKVGGLETLEISGKTHRCYRVELTVNDASATAWYSTEPGHRLVKFSGKSPLRPADTTELTLKE